MSESNRYIQYLRNCHNPLVECDTQNLVNTFKLTLFVYQIVNALKGVSSLPLKNGAYIPLTLVNFIQFTYNLSKESKRKSKLDNNYQTYLNRVARMTLPEAYKSQVQHIQESFKFKPNSERVRQASPFPGYTVITPPYEEDAANSAFYNTLIQYQQQLLELPFHEGLIVPVPTNSLHFTLADLIWDSAYRDACESNPNFEEDLRSCFTEIFQSQDKLLYLGNSSIRWQMLGLLVMPRAIGVCLVPQNEVCYGNIINLRRAIYQNPKLVGLGIEQHYHFTAHITLGYFGEIPSDLDRERLALMFSNLNQEWLPNSPEMVVTSAQLRKFDDMNRFYREPDWPILDFDSQIVEF